MSSELKAGFFVLAALASLYYMTTRLTQDHFGFHGTKRYYAQVSDASGLLSKTKVKMAGLDVGRLENIELSGKHAKLKMQITSDVVLHQDATVALRTLGFLGDKYIELHPGSESSPVMPEGGVLAESGAGGSLEELTSKTTEVVENIKEITNVLKDAIKGADGKNLEPSRFDRILDNMETFSEGLASLDRLGELSDRLADTADNLKDITDKVKRGEGTVGKLFSDSETVDKLNNTLSGVNKFITRADKLSIGVDGRSGYLLGPGSSKSSVALLIQPTYDKYYRLGITASPKGVTRITQTAITTNPNQPNAVTGVVQEAKTEQTAVGFDVQFAKRFWDFTFRLGLFESTGGVAVDFNFLEDKALLYSEVYHFLAGEKPQVNFGSQLQVFKPFYLWVGGEDLMNKDNRSFIVGAGIRFNDQDIKSLVSSASVAR